MKFRVFWCYGTLTLVVIAAMLTRTWYLEVTDELENKPDKKYLSWRIKYMQIEAINQFMLVWSMGCIVTLFLFYAESKSAKAYLLDVFARWLVAAALFMAYYSSIVAIWGTGEAVFHPSGHVTASLIAQASHLSYYLFAIRDSTTDELFLREQLLIARISLLLFVFFQSHACYSTFFAAFVFHTQTEVVCGWLAGLTICILSYETDYLINTLNLLLKVQYKAVLKLFKKKETPAIASTGETQIL